MFDVSVKSLEKAVGNPFENPPWATVDSINPDDITDAIEDKKFETKSYVPGTESSYEFHIERIAYLVVHPNNNPLFIKKMSWGIDIIDGFHRLAAAIYRGDKTIKAAFTGTQKELHNWLSA